MASHKKEILTDNTKIHYCDQCNDCTLWGIGDDPFQNKYDKSSCSMYPYPGCKPGYVINNEGVCVYRTPRKDEQK